MKIQSWLMAILGLLLNSGYVIAQPNEPSPPRMRVVSVDPATNDVTIEWTNSIDPAFPLSYHTPRKLEYPRVQPTPTSYPIGSIVPAPNSSTIIPNLSGTLVDVAPQAFCLTATSTVPGSNESALTDYHYPVFLTSSVDSCDARATLRWTPYKTTNDLLQVTGTFHDPFNRSIEYEVWGYQGVSPFNQGLAVKLSDKTKDTMFLSNILDKGKNYFFFIKSYLPEGAYLPLGDEISYSNKVDATYIGSAIPSNISLSQIEVKDNSVELNFHIASNSELTEYRVERTKNLAEGFSPIYIFQDKTISSYIDNDVNTSETYFYQISALNCDIFVKRSDISNTIILSSEYQTSSAFLQWTSHLNPGSTYSVTRIVPDNITIASNLSDSSHVNSIHSLIQQGYDKFCYQVTATAPSGETSISQPSCFIVEPPVYMADAIDPTKTIANATSGAQRNKFGPIVDMNNTVYGYKLIVFNRWGIKVFETTKERGAPISVNNYWDGQYKGKLVEPGVYLYTITVHFPNSQVSQKGNVTVFY